MIMIKLKQVVIIKKTMKQVMVVMIVMIVMIKETYKLKDKVKDKVKGKIIIITNDNKRNNDKDYVSKNNNE